MADPFPGTYHAHVFAGFGGLSVIEFWAALVRTEREISAVLADQRIHGQSAATEIAAHVVGLVRVHESGFIPA